MSNWEIRYGSAAVSVSYRNTIGAGIISVSQIADHASSSQTPPCGIFVLTFLASNKVSIEAKNYEDLKSPALWVGWKDVVADQVTSNLDIIPGLDFKICSGLYDGWQSEVGIGCYWDDANEKWRRITAFGLGIGGIEGKESYISVYNNTGLDQTNCRAILTNGARIENGQDSYRPIYAFRQTGLLNPVAHTDLDGIGISFDNYVGGSPATVDILVSGSQIDVYDVTGDSLISNGVGLKCDDTNVYRFADGTDYQSCEFILSSSLAQTDYAQIYVSDGGDFIEVYDDESGDFVDGPDGAYITASNCGMGVVPSGDYAEFRVRLNPSAGETVGLNQRQISVRINSEGI